MFLRSGVSERSIVGDVFNDVIDIVSVFAVWVGATSHEVKKTNDWDFEFFLVRVSAIDVRKFAL